MNSPETTLRIALGGIEDFSEALRWALDTYDTRFANATMVTFELTQVLVIDEDSTEDRYEWTAVLSGLLDDD